MHRHPITLAVPVGFFLAGTIIASIVSSHSADLGARIAGIVNSHSADLGSSILLIAWGLWLLLAMWLVWKGLAWSQRYVIYTRRRIILAEGVFKRSVETLPLTKVTDIRVNQTILGPLFGYGDFIVESAGRDQAPSRISFMPYPERLRTEIVALILSRTA